MNQNNPHWLEAGDLVEVVRAFYFYDDYFQVGARFHITAGQVKHNFESYVKKIG